MPAQTFAQIAAIARALPHGRPDDLADRVKYMIDCAEVNAHETIHMNKAASEDDFAALALATLESNLCDCGDHEVCKWFAENDLPF